jgi:hypothetical protein
MAICLHPTDNTFSANMLKLPLEHKKKVSHLCLAVVICVALMHTI